MYETQLQHVYKPNHIAHMKVKLNQMEMNTY